MAENETDLLRRIGEGPPGDVRARYDDLSARSRAGGLSAEEYSELTRLSDRLENFDVERAGYLIDLARLRGVPVGELMRDLGIGPVEQ